MKAKSSVERSTVYSRVNFFVVFGMAHWHINKFLVQGLLVLVLSFAEFKYGYTFFMSSLSTSTTATTTTTVAAAAAAATTTNGGNTIRPRSTIATPTTPSTSEALLLLSSTQPATINGNTFATPLPSSSTSSSSTARPTRVAAVRESLVIPAKNSEREAQELYDKALKQYGSYGASARKVCATWELRGCHCYGTVEELTLTCRNVGFADVPSDLPFDIIKLCVLQFAYIHRYIYTFIYLFGYMSMYLPFTEI